MTDASTPLMRQYNGIKQQVPNALLMFRLGDFYELFFDDAVTAARELEITLTARNKEKGAAIPMCGVPYHAAEGYIARLIQKGYRVAICDQMEDPQLAKKLVKREITRIVTPGTAMDAQPAALAREQLSGGGGAQWRRARPWRTSTSRPASSASPSMDPAEVAGALEHLGAREVLFPADLPLLTGEERAGPRFVRTELEDWIFTPRLRRPHAARSLPPALARWLRPGQPPGRGRRRRRHPALPARHAARRARSSRPPDLSTTAPIRMVLDAVTVRNLELVEPIFAGDAGGSQAQLTLLGVLDQTLHRHGRPPAAPAPAAPVARPRRDRSSGSMPSANCCQQTILRAELRKQLGGILDLERLLAKVTLGSAGPRDLLALGRSLEKIPALKRCFDTQQAARLRNLHDRLDEVPDVAQPDSGRHRRRAAGESGRRRHHPRRLQRRARRAARPQPERQAVHRPDRSARAAAHRHRSR